MKIIEDKEVGDIWRTEHRQHHQDEYCERCTIDALIRKLVEERTLRFEETSHITRMVDEKDKAVKSFYIDSADWKDDD